MRSLVIGVCFAFSSLSVGCNDLAGTSKSQPVPPAAKKGPAQSQLDAAETTLKNLVRTQTQNRTLLDETTAEKAAILRELREAGVEDIANLEGNRKVQRLAQRLLMVEKERESLHNSGLASEEDIHEAKALIRRLKRCQLLQAHPGHNISDLEIEARRLEEGHGMEYSPTVVDDLRLQEVLNKELRAQVRVHQRETLAPAGVQVSNAKSAPAPEKNLPSDTYRSRAIARKAGEGWTTYQARLRAENAKNGGTPTDALAIDLGANAVRRNHR